MSAGTWKNLDSFFLWSASSTNHKAIVKKMEALFVMVTESHASEDQTQAIV